MDLCIRPENTIADLLSAIDKRLLEVGNKEEKSRYFYESLAYIEEEKSLNELKTRLLAVVLPQVQSHNENTIPTDAEIGSIKQVTNLSGTPSYYILLKRGTGEDHDTVWVDIDVVADRCNIMGKETSNILGAFGHEVGGLCASTVFCIWNYYTKYQGKSMSEEGVQPSFFDWLKTQTGE